MASEALGPAPWSVLPFILLLLSIAFGPLLFAAFWAKHYPKLSCVLAAIILVYYCFGLHDFYRVTHALHEYAGFIILIGSLYIVAGGIHLNVKGEAKPHVNVVYLLIGAVLANLLGTTGASMVLIRPWLRMNKYRFTGHHLVFFIFIVSNTGGCLTPIGDPPLFLGFLNGVPFWWVAQHCWPIWILSVGFLLILFYLIDSKNYRLAPESVRSQQTGVPEKWTFEGLGNILFLLLILASVFIERPMFIREGLMLAACVASWLSTPKSIHQANHFDFQPLQEVAILFFSLFVTMIPTLDLVRENAHRALQANTTTFYWGCGLLSSFLDNAPTYLTFFSAAFGLVAPSESTLNEASRLTPVLLQTDLLFSKLLLAVSVGAVLFGANTYIGNAPNLMVKSIVEHQKVTTPHFFAFLFKYTLPCMTPLLILIWLVFFRG